MKGNILDVKSGVIVHQANCMGVMGAGLALQLKTKWPQVFVDYIERQRVYGLVLGDVIVTEVGPELYVASLCGQHHYGRRRICYTKYPAVEAGLRSIVALDITPVHIPFGMSCGLAGGQWPELMKIINKVVPEAVIVRRGS